jgi:hypothetical protein
MQLTVLLEVENSENRWNDTNFQANSATTASTITTNINTTIAITTKTTTTTTTTNNINNWPYGCYASTLVIKKFN